MKTFFINLLRIIDKSIVKLVHWNHVPYSDNNYLYLNSFRYKGKPILLNDGTEISKGDWIAEIHIDNINIKGVNLSYPNLIKFLKEELKAMKQSFKEEPYSKIKAVYGVTVFHNILRRQGFTVIEVNNRLKRFFGSLWENILRLGLKNGNKKTRKKFIFSKECWLSKTQILNMNFEKKIKENKQNITKG